MTITNNLMTISSGKGGVGKTWFSITLAHAFALQGKKVLLIDADIGLANIDIQLGIVPSKDLAHVFANLIGIKEIIVPYLKGNFDLIAGRSGSGFLSTLSISSLHKFIKELLLIGKDYDHVIIDLEAGIGQTVKELIKASTTNIVLLNEEPTSLTDAYALIKVTRTLNPYVVITNASTEEQGKNIFSSLSRAAHKFMGIAPINLGFILKDTKIPQVIRLQTPLLSAFPESRSAQTVKQIADDLHKFITQKTIQTIVRN